MIEYEDFTAVFTGDAEGETEAQAINNFDSALKATIITASHHGASTFASNSQDWATAMAPEVLISSAGNRFFHPRCAATNRFTSLAATKSMTCGVAAPARTRHPAPSRALCDRGERRSHRDLEGSIAGHSGLHAVR